MSVCPRARSSGSDRAARIAQRCAAGFGRRCRVDDPLGEFLGGQTRHFFHLAGRFPVVTAVDQWWMLAEGIVDPRQQPFPPKSPETPQFCYTTCSILVLVKPFWRCSAGSIRSSAGSSPAPSFPRRNRTASSSRSAPGPCAKPVANRVVAAPAADRGQPVAGPVPARRSRQRSGTRSSGRPACRRNGSSSRSPRGCCSAICRGHSRSCGA